MSGSNETFLNLERVAETVERCSNSCNTMHKSLKNCRCVVDTQNVLSYKARSLGSLLLL